MPSPSRQRIAAPSVTRALTAHQVTCSKRWLTARLEEVVNVKQLRADHSDWHWTTIKHSFNSWRYIGERAHYSGYGPVQRVEVSAEAVLCGPGEDDFETRWMASYDGTRETFAMWSMRELGRRGF